MKYLFLVMLTLCFSCGKSSNSSNSQQNPQSGKHSDYICARGHGILNSLCMARVDWFIDAEVQGFPEEVAISIYGYEVFDSCSERNWVTKSIENDRVLLEMPDFRFPYSDKPLAFEIFDRGQKCNLHKSFYSNQDTPYAKNEITTDEGKYFEIYINL